MRFPLINLVLIASCLLLQVSGTDQINRKQTEPEKGHYETPVVDKNTNSYSEDAHKNSKSNFKSVGENTSGEIWTTGLADSLKKTTKTRRILAVFPYQGKSHHMILQKVINVLLERGHHVTMFTSVPMNVNLGHYKQVLIKPSIASWADIFEFEQMTSQTSWEARIDLEMLSESFMFPLYKSEEFKNLLVGDEQFDLVLLEPFFMQEPLVFLGQRFKCPVIGLATAITETNQDLFMGRTRNPSVEMEWTTCITKPTMNFYQRAANTFAWLVNILETRYYYLPKRESDFYRMVSYPGMSSLPPLKEMLKRISLTLSNSHQLVQYPTPVPPNLIMIPGLHISPHQSLTEELKSLLDNANNGAILFAMGTMTPVSKMKKEKEVFIEAFSRLDQLVLWKSDVDLPDLPTNVRTFKWLPQQAVLGHKNCLAFVTHGGMLSKQEAVYYGVPLISIPLFGDQLSNTGHSQATGMGLTLLYNNITVENLVSAINTVINDPQYRIRMGKNSMIFRETVRQSKSKVLYWIEHVMDHGGADYLRRDDVQLNWIQFYLLDVLAAFLLVLALAVFLLIKCGQGLRRLRFPSKNMQDSIKKTN